MSRRRSGHTTTVTINTERFCITANQRDDGGLLGHGLDQFFVPNGHTDDPEIPRVRSAVDYIARRLAIDWLPYPDRAALGVYTLTERVQQASTWIAAQEPLAGHAGYRCRTHTFGST
jgi:hypothetical protein